MMYMQTSNRDFPIENNLTEILHTIEKLSVRLPSLLSKEQIKLTNEQKNTLIINTEKIKQTALEF